MPLRVSLLLVVAFLTEIRAAEPVGWAQFRGPGGSALAPAGESPPVEFGAEKNLAWKVAVPSGVSSPSVWEDHIYLTAFLADESRLETLCLDRTNGKTIWRRPVPAMEIEKPGHKSGSPASGTPAADDSRVVVYYGSFGVLCYDHDGNELWNHPLPLPKRRFGSGTSPVLTGDVVLLARDDDPERQLLALDANNGAVLWKQPLPPARNPGMSEGYATPLVHGDEVILHHLGEISGFALNDGERRWSVSAATNAGSTPVIAGDTIYVATWNNFGEPDLRTKLPAFGDLVKANDKDADGLISREELPKDLSLSQRPGAGESQGGDVRVVWFFDQIDLNKDGKLNALEWATTFTLLSLMVSQSEHGLVALRADSTGAAPKVAWREKRFVPEIPSPVACEGRVYMIKDGGILTGLDGATGKLLYRKRVGAGGSYYASLVAADGRLYAASNAGVVTVLACGDEFRVLAQNDLREAIIGTPAILDDTLYVRTAGHLFAFRQETPDRP